MNTPKAEYWPFPVPDFDKQSNFDRELIQFMEMAYREDYRPCRFLPNDFGLESSTGKIAYLTSRGRIRKSDESTQWELWLGVGPDRHLGVWVNSFRFASQLAIDWMRGLDVAKLLHDSEGCIVRGPHFTPVLEESLVS